MQFFSTLATWIQYIVAILFVLFFIYAGITQGWEGIKDFWIFRKIIQGDNKGPVKEFLVKIANLPPKTVPKVLAQILLPIDTELYLEQLVREHTQVLGQEALIGLHNTPTGKVKTKYYVDILSACGDLKTREKLAALLASEITETARSKGYIFDAIAVSALGNVLLAAEVGDLLDKPVVLVGDLAGVTFPERINNVQGLAHRYIIIDGISATGEETLNVANTIKQLGGEVHYVFMIIDRCFGAKDRVRNQSPFSHPLELVYLGEFDDKRCEQLFSHNAPFNQNFFNLPRLKGPNDRA